MSAQYLLRLDDACPTMRSDTWSALEDLLDEHSIKPIVGVIPDNLDPAMVISPPDPDFWFRMRSWKSNGWEIVLHGLHHVYHLLPPNAAPLLGFSEKSEFVGLPLSEQVQMLGKGFSIMSDAGVKPRAFMAPSHSFDRFTLRALLDATDIRIIMDGHALWPFRFGGFTWLPQQLWRYYDLPFGIWCICLHPNSMSQRDVHRFAVCLRNNAHKFIDVDTALDRSRTRSVIDYVFAGVYQAALNFKSVIRCAPNAGQH